MIVRFFDFLLNLPMPLIYVLVVAVLVGLDVAFIPAALVAFAFIVVFAFVLWVGGFFIGCLKR